MLYLTTLSNDSIMLKKDDIIFMKSCGNAKTIIFLRGVDEKLMINASFEEIKFAINNNLQELPGGTSSSRDTENSNLISSKGTQNQEINLL